VRFLELTPEVLFLLCYSNTPMFLVQLLVRTPYHTTFGKILLSLHAAWIGALVDFLVPRGSESDFKVVLRI